MASEIDLHQLIPDDDDLKTVKSAEVREVLKSIFKLDKEGNLEASLEMVIKHTYKNM